MCWRVLCVCPAGMPDAWCRAERVFFIDNLLVRIHFIIVMIRWTGLAPWKFEFPFLGSIYRPTSTFLAPRTSHVLATNLRGLARLLGG